MMPARAGDEGRRSGILQTYDMEKEKLSTLSPGVLAYEVSGNGKVLVFQTKEGFTRVEPGATNLPKPDRRREGRFEDRPLGLVA